MKKIKQKRLIKNPVEQPISFLKCPVLQVGQVATLFLFFAVVVLFFVLLMNYSTSSIDEKNMTILVDIPPAPAS